MPATVTCPSCNTTLKPKTPVPAGTRIKCPKCQTVFAVPGDEEDVVAAAPAPRAAAPREESDDFAAMSGEPGDASRVERPKKKTPLWVWLVSAAGVLLLLSCGCCGTLVYFAPNMLGLKQGAESNSVSSANYDKIQKDMTEDQVKSILGEPTIQAGLAGVKSDTWKMGADTITVTFQNDKAMERTSNIAGTKKQGW